MFFLDEPTSGLDPGTEQKLMRVLNRLSKTQGKTIVMVTHTTQRFWIYVIKLFLWVKKAVSALLWEHRKKRKCSLEQRVLIEIYNLLEEDTESWAGPVHSS